MVSGFHHSGIKGLGCSLLFDRQEDQRREMPAAACQPSLLGEIQTSESVSLKKKYKQVESMQRMTPKFTL